MKHQKMVDAGILEGLHELGSHHGHHHHHGHGSPNHGCPWHVDQVTLKRKRHHKSPIVPLLVIAGVVLLVKSMSDND